MTFVGRSGPTALRRMIAAKGSTDYTAFTSPSIHGGRRQPNATPQETQLGPAVISGIARSNWSIQIVLVTPRQYLHAKPVCQKREGIMKTSGSGSTTTRHARESAPSPRSIRRYLSLR